MNLIIPHKVEQFFILDRHHLVERQWAIPLVRAEVQYQRNDRCNFIILIESGQVLASAVSFRAIGAMLCRYISNLLSILECIINDVADRHCIVNIGLTFNSQKDIGHFFVPYDDR